MARPLPYSAPLSGQSPVDLTSVTNVSPLHEHAGWTALSEVLLEAQRMDAFEIHLEPAADCLRARYRSVFEFKETRIDDAGALQHGLNLLRERLWDSDTQDMARREWFLFSVSTASTLFQLDIVPCSIGVTYLITQLNEALQLPARMEDIGLNRKQLANLKDVLQQKSGLVVVAAELPQIYQRTSRAITQNLVSPDLKVIVADTPMHPLIPRTSQLGMDFPATEAQKNNWQALCHLSADAIVATQTLDDEIAKQLINLSAERSLVISCISAGSAGAALARLLGFGVRSETLAHSLSTLVLQYRARCLCTYCRVGASPDDEHTDWLSRYSPIQASNVNAWLRHRMRSSFSQAHGCKECDDTGHRTSLDVFDIISVTKEVKDALFDADYQYAIAQIQKQQTLPGTLLKLAQEGIISLSEAARLTESIEA